MSWSWFTRSDSPLGSEEISVVSRSRHADLSSRRDLRADEARPADARKRSLRGMNPSTHSFRSDVNPNDLARCESI